MKARLESLITATRPHIKAALWAGDAHLALFYVRLIVGWQILIRMLERPECCQFPPSSFVIRL